jgi:transcriptional regulator with XRE-family HTH domain
VTAPPELGSLIQRLRKARGMRQQDLAAASGLTRSSVANIESGRQDLTVASLIAFAKALGVTLDVLTGLASPPEIYVPPGVTIRREYMAVCDECGPLPVAQSLADAQGVRAEHIRTHREAT